MEYKIGSKVDYIDDKGRRVPCRVLRYTVAGVGKHKYLVRALKKVGGIVPGDTIPTFSAYLQPAKHRKAHHRSKR